MRSVQTMEERCCTVPSARTSSFSGRIANGPEGRKCSTALPSSDRLYTRNGEIDGHAGLRPGIVDRIGSTAAIDEIGARARREVLRACTAIGGVVAQSELDKAAGRCSLEAVVEVIAVLKVQDERIGSGRCGLQGTDIDDPVIASIAYDGDVYSLDRSEIRERERAVSCEANGSSFFRHGLDCAFVGYDGRGPRQVDAVALPDDIPGLADQQVSDVVRLDGRQGIAGEVEIYHQQAAAAELEPRLRTASGKGIIVVEDHRRHENIRIV